MIIALFLFNGHRSVVCRYSNNQKLKTLNFLLDIVSSLLLYLFQNIEFLFHEIELQN